MNIAIIDDHQIIRIGLRLQLQPTHNVVLDSDNAELLFSALHDGQLDAVLLDIWMPGMSGLDIARKMRQEFPAVKVLFLSTDTSQHTLTQIMAIGVDGFLSKNCSQQELLDALEQVAQGRVYYGRDIEAIIHDIQVARQTDRANMITDREMDVLAASCAGKTTQDIADMYHISARTVENYKASLFHKLGVSNIVELISLAVEKNIIRIQ